MAKLKQVKENPKNILHFLLGSLRYKLYYSKFKNLLRVHVREQIDFRIRWMDQECYNQGSCKECGCTTTALQMANKACDKPCYPTMMDKKTWREFRFFNKEYTDENGIWQYFPYAKYRSQVFPDQLIWKSHSGKTSLLERMKKVTWHAE